MRLTRLQRAWQRNHHTLRQTLASSTDQADDYAHRARAIAIAITRSHEIRGDAFHITIDGQTASTRADAGQLLARWATIHQHAAAARPLPLGQLAGLDLDARVHHNPTDGHQTLTITLRDMPASPAELALGAVTRDASPLIRQLEHRIRDLPALQQRLATRQKDTLSEAAAARHALAQPFKYAAELDQAAATRADITQRIKARHEHDATRDASPPGAGGHDEAAPERQHLDIADAQRLAAAAFPSPIPATPGASPRDASRPPGQPPPRRLPTPPRRSR